MLGVRNVQKGEEAARRIRSVSPSADCRIDVLHLDMCSFESVKAFSKQINSTLDRLDFAILNAGADARGLRYTADGFEETLQVNVLCTGYLARLLLPKLQGTSRLPRPNATSNLVPHLTIAGSEGMHRPITAALWSSLTSAA